MDAVTRAWAFGGHPTGCTVSIAVRTAGEFTGYVEGAGDAFTVPVQIDPPPASEVI